MEKRRGRRKDTVVKGEDFITHPVDLDRARTGPKLQGTLGDRIRKARETHGLTIKELGDQTGIDADMLDRVEANRAIPPLGDLVKLGRALETGMSYLVSPGTDRPMTVVRADQRREASRHIGKKGARHGYSYESLAPEKANRSMEPFVVTLTPSEAVRPSTHDGQEFLFVLQGQILVQVGGQREHLEPGDAVYYDSTEPHFVECVDGREAKILAVIHPGGQ
ncbi:MAG: helix-turn-helix domain-containing protein [Chloroflexi bacterium]|nr:helix-turn-helix domain-containing protein [Chloroflexota bacterium]